MSIILILFLVLDSSSAFIKNPFIKGSYRFQQNIVSNGIIPLYAKNMKPPVSNKKNTTDLEFIDNEINKLVENIQSLKKTKSEKLSNIKGLKLSNETYQYEKDYEHFSPGIRFLIQNKEENKQTTTVKSENFEIIKNSEYSFKDIGGYDNIKNELKQCSDLLVNFEKYKKFGVRTPKGLIFEGPPGNGKTLLAKCFSGEINSSFIAVSGSQFLEKYVGVGSSRIRELFTLAYENKPCIIFIDEIDAVGRKRSEESSSNVERDNTLNELLVALDGFKSTEGVFLIGATNRIDLLDDALTRPGRIDKSIYIGLPDKNTRNAIIDIHIQGKPRSSTVNKYILLEKTQGFSGAQIENFINEAMLYALRNNREEILLSDLDYVLNRILTGSQSTENIVSEDILYRISIHEMGHALVGMLSDHNKLIKVALNLWSPKSPGYTLFETSDEMSIYTKEKLMSHLMVLYGGRIAEEVFFNNSITTGASHDLEEARKLAEQMIMRYGMGKSSIYPYSSDKYKEAIDNEINSLLKLAYKKAKRIVINEKDTISDCANILMQDHTLSYDVILEEINKKKNKKVKE
jgi:cell division protease FtsH